MNEIELNANQYKDVTWDSQTTILSIYLFYIRFLRKSRYSAVHYKIYTVSNDASHIQICESYEY